MLGLRWRSVYFVDKRIVIEHKVLVEKENGVLAVKGYDVMKTIPAPQLRQHARGGRRADEADSTLAGAQQLFHYGRHLYPPGLQGAGAIRAGNPADFGVEKPPENSHFPGVWRRRRDSNPRTLADNLISRGMK